MNTFMEKKETVERKWYVIDAEGKSLGRVASLAATYLRGKNKPTYTPHSDAGDYVIIVNASKAIFTGKKMTDKYYFRYSGYVGGDKYTQAKEAMRKNPSWVIEHAIKGMLPKNSLGREMFKKLKVYNEAEHPHEAQKPRKIDIKGKAN